MKRRWSLFFFIVVWLVILLVPPLRRMFWIQVAGGGFYRGWAYGPLPDAFGGQPASIADRYPDDPRVLAVELERGYYNADKPQFFRDYDRLLTRFPHQSWLLARRLSKAVDRMRSDRVGGELSDWNIQANKADGSPSPERTNEKPNFTRDQLETVLTLARRGQELEPDNAYWDWLLVYFLFSDWRDGEARRALAIGSHKPRFDGHESEWMQTNVAVRELELGRPLLLEEKIVMRAAVGIGTGNDGRFREMARIITWEGIKAERSADHQAALRIYSDFARLMIGAERGAYDVLDALVFQAIADLPLMGDGRRVSQQEMQSLTTTSPQIFRKLWRLKANKFAVYASAHGQPDLAREMSRLCREIGQRADARNLFAAPSSLYYCIPARSLVWAIVLWWAAALTLLLLPMLALWWLLLGAALRLAHVPDVVIARRDVGIPVVFVVGLTAASWIVAFALGLGWHTLFGIGMFKDTPDYFAPLSRALLALGLILPGPLATLTCWWGTRRAKGALRLSWRERWHGVRLAGLFLGIALTGYLLGAAAWWLLCLSYASGFALIPIDLPESFNRMSDVFPLWPQFAFALSLAIVWLRWLFLPSLFLPSPDKTLIAQRLRCLHAALGALFVVASVAYLLLLVASLPVRAVTDRQINQLLQRGEVALMLQNSGQ